MRNRVTFGAVSALLVGGIIAVGSWFTAERESVLTVAFLDVGQGDAIFIESPTGTQILIDGGPDASIIRRLSEVMGWRDRSIDALLISNPDQDHIRGFIDVLSRYEVGTVFEPGTKKETAAYEALSRSIAEEGAEQIIARRGMSLDLGGGSYLEILFPDRDAAKFEANAGSLIARLVYGETEVFLPGDAPDEIEEYVVALGGDLQSDMLKAGHHGSRTSTGEALLAAVAPSVAVLSAGKGNRYGHPHREVLERLLKSDVETLITAQEGTLIFTSDGTAFTRLR